ncbi:MAG: AMIN domain-containing protein, partial [Proteobacteria bacterium]|nr:AMIN domain-containing protein [Pseudomonadota bacterium]
MNKLGKYTVLLLLLCGNAVSMQKKDAGDDPSALFKLPTQKATVRYIKKGGKEFVYVKGKDLNDYTVITNNKGISVNVMGHNIKAKANLSKKSSYVKNINTSITDDGSKIDLKLKDKTGFKIYRRPSGLVLAMGPGYQEIAEETLQGLDSDASKPLNVDNELDNMLKDTNAEAATAAGAPAAGSTAAPAGGENLDAMINNLETESIAAEATPAKKPAAEIVSTAVLPSDIDKDLDRIVSEADSDLALYEQKQVESNLNRPAVIENIKIDKGEDGIQLVIQTDKSVKYQQKKSKPGYNQIILEIQNSTIIKQINNIDTSPSGGLITSVTPQQMNGPYKSVRVIVQLSQDIKPEISQ